MARKKILCILIVAAFFLSFGLQAVGEEADEIQLTVRYDLGYYQAGSNGTMRGYAFGAYSAVAPGARPSASFAFSYRNMYERNCLEVINLGWLDDQSANNNVIVGGYTYKIIVSLVVNKAVNSNPPAGVPADRYVYFDPGVKFGYADFSGQSPLSYDDYIALPDVTTLGGNGLNYYTSSSVQDDGNGRYIDVILFSFRFDNDYSGNNDPFDMFSMYIGSGQLLLNTDFVSGDDISISIEELSAYYDPTGYVMDDVISDSDDIIADQIEAVKEGLRLETEASEEALQEALAGADTSIFDLTSYSAAFTQLFDGLNYQGSSFSFKLPSSGVVPYLNTTLWPEVEIPFKEWIDKMPSGWLIIARFVAWLGLAFAFIHRIKVLIADINGGGGEDD